MLHHNAELKKSLHISPWRKISIGSWRPTGDSSIYTSLHLDMETVLKYCKKHNISTNTFLIRTLAKSIALNPQINSIIRFGKIYPRKNIDIFFHVVSDVKTGEDLTGILFKSPHLRKNVEVEEEYRKKIVGVKTNQDPSFYRIKTAFVFFPALFSRFILTTTSFVLYSLNLWSRFMGVSRDSFGSVMLTSVGSLGIEMAYCPIAPYTRIPMVVSAGSIAVRPWVKNGKVIAKNTMILCFTYDHRIMDGIHFKWLQDTLVDFFKNPEKEIK